MYINEYEVACRKGVEQKKKKNKNKKKIKKIKKK